MIFALLACTAEPEDTGAAYTGPEVDYYEITNAAGIDVPVPEGATWDVLSCFDDSDVQRTCTDESAQYVTYNGLLCEAGSQMDCTLFPAEGEILYVWIWYPPEA